MAADLAILEEAAYIDPNLFKTVVIPLVMMKRMFLLAISSPSDEVHRHQCTHLLLFFQRTTQHPANRLPVYMMFVYRPIMFLNSRRCVTEKPVN